MKNASLPTIGITLGDAAGIGPEIIMKSLAHAELYDTCRPVVIGDAGRLREAGQVVGSNLEVNAINRIADAKFTPGTVDCIDLKLIPAGMPWGKLSPIAGDAAYQYIARAVELAKADEIDAICTAPLNKEALHAGGHKFPGHTEMLAALTIGVCGINPHAGEHGLFGHGEEEAKIEPAVKRCQEKGWNVEGPLPADTLFFRAGRGDFDLVVAMYHDQGHGPVKVLGIEAGVNITVGLPKVIRTSVDHGTAFDIAGKGIADERSLLVAIEQAVELAPRR